MPTVLYLEEPLEEGGGEHIPRMKQLGLGLKGDHRQKKAAIFAREEVCPIAGRGGGFF